MAQFIDDEIYPVSASALGTNAYYIPNCKEVGHNAAYASCLKKIKDRKEGRLDAQYSDCSAAIGRKDCPAMAMRKEEELENKAIYFINRKKLQSNNQFRDEMAASQARADNVKSASKFPNKSTRAVEPVGSIAIPESSYAAAINNAMQEMSKEETVTSKSVIAKQKEAPPVVINKTGMSLLDMARARMANASN